MKEWLENTANAQVHGTTGRKPIEMYEEEEREHMRPYLTPGCVNVSDALIQHKVDKTGPIPWDGNKYSVPMAYQGSRVGIEEVGTMLAISDLCTGEKIAGHKIHHGKGQTIKNNHHYRDLSKRIEDLEVKIGARSWDRGYGGF
nr:hypothetical protein [Desulfobacterales bacterium]